MVRYYSFQVVVLAWYGEKKKVWAYDVSQDKELNRRIGLATMTSGKLKSMVFTSKKVSLRVKNHV